MSDTIILRGIVVELTGDLARAFVADACRAGESVIDDSTLMEKYDLTPEDLQKLANNKQIGRAIRNEREHRLRSGIATRELAAKSYFKAPTVLDSILMNDKQAHATGLKVPGSSVLSPHLKINPIQQRKVKGS
jgi:hypothetical protein